jgi:hypothetical protein
MTILFDLPKAVHVRLFVYNINGELISTCACIRDKAEKISINLNVRLVLIISYYYSYCVIMYGCPFNRCRNPGDCDEGVLTKRRFYDLINLRTTPRIACIISNSGGILGGHQLHNPHGA